MAKLNCWEFKKCGREPGGLKTSELGICPAASNTRGEGIHGGKNCGRCCWVLSGTFCGGKVQGIYAAKLASCIACDFYKLVTDEEGRNRIDSMEILAKLA